jgi:hypothetical protein
VFESLDTVLDRANLQPPVNLLMVQSDYFYKKKDNHAAHNFPFLVGKPPVGRLPVRSSMQSFGHISHASQRSKQCM